MSLQLSAKSQKSFKLRRQPALKSKSRPFAENKLSQDCGLGVNVHCLLFEICAIIIFRNLSANSSSATPPNNSAQIVMFQKNPEFNFCSLLFQWYNAGERFGKIKRNDAMWWWVLECGLVSGRTVGVDRKHMVSRPAPVWLLVPGGKGWAGHTAPFYLPTNPYIPPLQTLPHLDPFKPHNTISLSGRVSPKKLCQT